MCYTSVVHRSVNGGAGIEVSSASGGSYRELGRIPGMPALAVSVGLSRWVLDGMLPVTLVLTSLRLFGSPAIAGLVVFLGTFPGLVLTPFAGALLDRRGRIAFIRLDVMVAIAVFAVVAGLIAAGRLSVPVLAVAAVLLSCTRPLAQAGARAQVPTMTPERLWDRVNAVDTAVFTLVALTAPAAGSLLFALVGPVPVFAVGAGLLGVAALVLTRVPESEIAGDGGSLWRETRRGISYFVRNRTLVLLSVSSSLLNIAPGTVIVVLPTIVVGTLHDPAWVVGALLALQELGAALALILTGRYGTRGRERTAMSVGAALIAAGMVLMLAGGMALTALGLFVVGVGSGPYWVALYGLRQRRTLPHMFARAFAISYACNMAGMPLGSAVAGTLSSGGGVRAALVVGVVCPVLAIAVLRGLPGDRPRIHSRPDE
jgi:MFS family permease